MNATGRTAVLLLALAYGCGPGDEEHDHEEHDHEEGEEHDHEESEEHGHEGEEPEDVVRVTAAAIKRNRIRVESVRSERLSGGVDVPAEVSADPDRKAHVSPLVDGQLVSVTASIGDRVEAGQVLAEMRSIALGEARSALAAAQASVGVARSNFDRQEELQREGIGARREYLEAQAELRRAQAEIAAARQRLSVYGPGGSGSTTVVRSPLAGVVVERHANVGEVVGPGRDLFVVADTSQVWVLGRVYQQDVRAARTGAAAVLRLQAYSGASWEATIDYVSPTLDEETRTLEVRVVLDNPTGALRPGLFGTLSITPPGAAPEDVPTICEEAVQELEGAPVVFIPGEEEGEFHAVPVVLGERSGGRVEVRQGLSAGDGYVSTGAFVLKSELLRSQLGHGHAH